MESEKKIIFSGVQPSGIVTIGNYLGSIRNWVDIQQDYRCIYCVVDMHAITVRQTPADLRRRTYELRPFIWPRVSTRKRASFVQSQCRPMRSWHGCLTAAPCSRAVTP